MREFIRINNDQLDFSRKESFENFQEYQLHCHSIYEIYYFVEGEIEFMVEGRIYHPKRGSIMLFKPGVVHGVKVDPNRTYVRYAFHFTPEILPAEHRNILLSVFGDSKFYYEDVNLENSFDKVLGTKNMPKKVRNIALSSLFESLLTELYTLKHHSGEDEDVFEGAQQIVKFINENIHKDMDLDFIAKEFYISKSSLNRLFKKSMNITVGSYISLKRINIARELLHSGENAEKVAIKTGFKDYSTFYRTYKKIMGHSPAKSLNYNLLIDPVNGSALD